MEATLFIGLPIDPLSLQSASPALIRFFLPYLDRTTIDGRPCFGKCLHEPVSLEQLEQIQMHVHSLLKKMFPDSSFPALTCYSLCTDPAMT